MQQIASIIRIQSRYKLLYVENWAISFKGSLQDFPLFTSNPRWSKVVSYIIKDNDMLYRESKIQLFVFQPITK